MTQSIDLLNHALKTYTHGDLADALGVGKSALSNCKKTKQLTPVIAGNLALFLNENVEGWTALAAAESVRECPAKKRLIKALEARVKSSFSRISSSVQKWAKDGFKRLHFASGDTETGQSKINCCVAGVV